MSIPASLTRMWLTRTTKSFTFKTEYDQLLPFAQCDQLGLYVRIAAASTPGTLPPY